MDFLSSSVLRSVVKLNTGNWSDQESYFKLLLVSFSWTTSHIIVHWSLPGDSGWSAVWLQLLSGRGEGTACQCQSSGAEEVLGWVWAIQVGETAALLASQQTVWPQVTSWDDSKFRHATQVRVICISYFNNKAIQNALHNTYKDSDRIWKQYKTKQKSI